MTRTNTPKSPTLATVAAHVGVSRMTVSNAFNRPDQLSPALRERVLETARQLGYQGPNPVARTLARGRTGSLGVVFDYSLTDALTDPAAAGVLLGVARECEARSLGLTLVPMLAGGGDETHVRTALVDGFVLYSVTRHDARLRAVQERGLPYVLVDHEPTEGAPRVNIDDRGGARAMVDHVVGLGHRRIGFAFGWSNPFATLAAAQANPIYFVGAERMAGWRDGLEAAGLGAEAPIGSGPAHGLEAGRVAAHRLLDLPEPPTAILAFSDLLALGAIAAAAERGLDVPGQLSVIGFDDVAAAATATPPLTTVRQAHDEKGAAAVRLLLDPDHDDDQLVLPAELVVRSTTAPPPPQEGSPCS